MIVPVDVIVPPVTFTNVPLDVATEVTPSTGNVANDKSPKITCEAVPAPAILIVPDPVIGEPVIVNALPVSVNAIDVTVLCGIDGKRTKSPAPFT